MSEPKRYGLSRETCDIVEWRYGPYVGIEDYQKIEDKCQRYKAEVKRLTKPGCTRTLRDTIEEQNKQIEALKRDVLEQAAEIRNLNEVIADLHNQADDDLDSIETERIENARLKAEIERLGAFKTHTIIPNEKLQTQVDRLTKAGEELYFHIWIYINNNRVSKSEYRYLHKLCDAWQAARTARTHND